MSFFVCLGRYFYNQDLDVGEVWKGRFHDELKAFLLDLLEDLRGDVGEWNVLIAINSIRVQFVTASINGLLEGRMSSVVDRGELAEGVFGINMLIPSAVSVCRYKCKTSRPDPVFSLKNTKSL